MFVFWYCHKRGKQVRLDRESEASKAAEAGEKEEFDGSDFDATDSEEGEVDDAAEKIAAAVKNDGTDKDAILNQPEPGYTYTLNKKATILPLLNTNFIQSLPQRM